MRPTTKRLAALGLAAAMALCAVPRAAAAGQRYYDWKQYDPRWGSVVLTSQTMKQVGCLATSVAMLAVHAGLRHETSFDPGVFAAEMKQAGGFSADDDLIWEALPKAVPGFTAEAPWEALNGTQAEKTAQLKGYLDGGRQVAVAVRSGRHWVALRSVAGGKAVMMDPGSAATDLFAAYPAAGVTRAALLRAEKPTPPSAPPKEGATMAGCVLAFLKDMGGLLLAIFRYVLAMGK